MVCRDYPTGASLSTALVMEGERTVNKIGFQVEPDPLVQKPPEVAQETGKKAKKSLRWVAVKIGAEFQEFLI